MSTSNSPPPKNRSAFLTAFILTVFHAAVSISSFVIAFRIDAIKMQWVAYAILVYALILGISTILIRSRQTILGGWLIIITLAIGIPAISWFAFNLGWASLIAIPLIVALTANQTLPTKRIPIALSIGVLAGIAAFLIDLFGPKNRVALPLVEFIVPAIVLALIFIVGFLVLQRFQTYTLQTKLLILFLVIAILPLALLAIVNNQVTRRNFTQAANLSLSSTGGQTANQIDNFFENTINTIQAEAQLSVLREYLTYIEDGRFAYTTDAVVTLATLRSKDIDRILSYALLDRDGSVLLRYPIDNVAYPPFFGANQRVENGMRTSMLDGKTYASPVLFDAENQASIYFVTAVYNIIDYTSPVGMLVVQYDAIILQDLMVAQNELGGADSFGVIFDENQLHLAHGIDPSTLYKTVASLPPPQIEELIELGRLPDLPPEELSTDLPELSAKLDNANSEPFFRAIDVATGDRINQVAVSPLESQPWQVGFFQPEDVYLSIADQQTRATIILVLVVAGVVALSSIGATRILVAPINTLTDIVEFIAGGDLSLQAPVISRDEVGRLATAFNAMTSQVRNLLSGLEQQVAERTQDFERQAVQLQTAAQVARDASSLQDLNDLLNRTVNLIHDRFGFYHAGIFLLDERKEFAVLRAANSEGGKEMLKQGHKLRVGQMGIVGYVTSTGEPRIARDVGADVAHFAHPQLPETHSEMALPLIVGERIIGAIDVQSKEPAAFDEGDITVLQVLADQLAVAIENARLLSEVRQSVYDLQTAYGEFTQESWQRWAQPGIRPSGYRYRGAGIEPVTEQSPETILAFRQGKMITKVSETDHQSSLALPIQLRDQTFGIINLRFEGEEIPPEMISLVENISNRLASALDSARLYEETQRRAIQEQLTSEIAVRIRESLDIDAVLKTAVQEIGQKLDLHDVSIQIDMNGNSTSERES